MIVDHGYDDPRLRFVEVGERCMGCGIWFHSCKCVDMLQRCWYGVTDSTIRGGWGCEDSFWLMD